MHSDLEASLDLNCFSEDKFFPSLLPKWLYETQDFGLIPADVKKSMKAVLNFVCPVLKSFPMRMPLDPGTLDRAGTNVFWGDPLIKTQFYSIAAIAKIIDGDISGWSFLIPLINASYVSWTSLKTANL